MLNGIINTHPLPPSKEGSHWEESVQPICALQETRSTEAKLQTLSQGNRNSRREERVTLQYYLSIQHSYM